MCKIGEDRLCLVPRGSQVTKSRELQILGQLLHIDRYVSSKPIHYTRYLSSKSSFTHSTSRSGTRRRLFGNSRLFLNP